MTVWLRGWLANETSPKSQAQLSRSEKAPSSGPFAITVPATWLLARNAASSTTSSSKVWGSELLTPQPVERSGRSSLVATPNSQLPTTNYLLNWPCDSCRGMQNCRSNRQWAKQGLSAGKIMESKVLKERIPENVGKSPLHPI